MSEAQQSPDPSSLPTSPPTSPSQPLDAHTQRPDNLAPLPDRIARARMTAGELAAREIAEETAAAQSVVHRRHPDGSVTIEPRQPGNDAAPAANDGSAPAGASSETVKVGEFELSADDVREFLLHKSTQANIPTSADAYEAKLPEGFQLPEGVEFKVDPNDPALADARAFALRHKLTGQQFQEMLGIYATIQARDTAAFNAAHAAEVQKLGANGTQRVTAIENFLRGHVGDQLARPMRTMLVTAGIVEGFEKLMTKFSSQGAASFRQDGREPGGRADRVSDEQWAGMSNAQKIDYARQFPQPQFAERR